MIIVGFQQRDRQISKTFTNATFYRPPVTSAQCITGTEKYPGSGILLDYDEDEYSQGYVQIKEAFRDLTNADILQPYICDNGFTSSNSSHNIGYYLYVFEIRFQKNLESAHPIKVEFRFSENVPAGIYGYALVLTNKLVCLGSDGQHHFDIIQIQGFHNIFIFLL